MVAITQVSKFLKIECAFHQMKRKINLEFNRLKKIRKISKNEYGFERVSQGCHSYDTIVETPKKVNLSEEFCRSPEFLSSIPLPSDASSTTSAARSPSGKAFGCKVKAKCSVKKCMEFQNPLVQHTHAKSQCTDAVDVSSNDSDLSSFLTTLDYQKYNTVGDNVCDKFLISSGLTSDCLTLPTNPHKRNIIDSTMISTPNSRKVLNHVGQNFLSNTKDMESSQKNRTFLDASMDSSQSASGDDENFNSFEFETFLKPASSSAWKITPIKSVNEFPIVSSIKDSNSDSNEKCFIEQTNENNSTISKPCLQVATASCSKSKEYIQWNRWKELNVILHGKEQTFLNPVKKRHSLSSIALKHSDELAKKNKLSKSLPLTEEDASDDNLSVQTAVNNSHELNHSHRQVNGAPPFKNLFNTFGGYSSQHAISGKSSDLCTSESLADIPHTSGLGNTKFSVWKTLRARSGSGISNLNNIYCATDESNISTASGFPRKFELSSIYSSRSAYSAIEWEELSTSTFASQFVDSHCHLDFLFNRIHHSGTLSSLRTKLDTGEEQGLKFPVSFEGCVAVFCQPDLFYKTNWISSLVGDKGVWAAFGCHPHFSNQFGQEELQQLERFLNGTKVVALGEIGLDYSYKNLHKPDIQKPVFKMQLQLAKQMQLPLVIHSREAHDDTLHIMKQYVDPLTRIHNHCFAGSLLEAQDWLQSFPHSYLGLTNMITQRNQNARRLCEVVRHIPLDRLLLETDSPYFVPEFVRNAGWHASHPGHALLVAAEIARIKDLPIDDVLITVRQNTKNMYGI